MRLTTNIDLTPGNKQYNVKSAPEERCEALIKKHNLVYSEEFGLLITLSPARYKPAFKSKMILTGIEVTPATVEHVKTALTSKMCLL